MQNRKPYLLLVDCGPTMRSVRAGLCGISEVSTRSPYKISQVVPRYACTICWNFDHFNPAKIIKSNNF
jgi:hypothetical protein